MGLCHAVPGREVRDGQPCDDHHAMPIVDLDPAAPVDDDHVAVIVGHAMEQLVLLRRGAHPLSLPRGDEKPDTFRSAPRLREGQQFQEATGLRREVWNRGNLTPIRGLRSVESAAQACGSAFKPAVQARMLELTCWLVCLCFKWWSLGWCSRC